MAWTAAPDTVPYFRSSRALKYGWKRYEVTDHLGNVRALISDRKTYNGTVFMPAILNATDYFPFGSEMRGSVTAGNQKHRYGFNGKELDKNGEFGGVNHYDYGFRIYNPGIARFLSVDPLTGKYPELTPYQFASNTPIWAIDLDGLEAWIVTKSWNAFYIEKFHRDVFSRLDNIRNSGQHFTCDDFGLESIISFAKDNQLPFKWNTGARNFDAESPEFKDYNTFLLQVKLKSGAPDFANPENATSTQLSNIENGTLVVLTAEGRERPNHIQIITGVSKGENNQVENYSILQGNFRADFWGGRWTGSGNPGSEGDNWRYLGVPIQEGAYFLKQDTYLNYTLGTETLDFSDHYPSIDYRNFNFLNWNKKFEYEKKTKSTSVPGGFGTVGQEPKIYWEPKKEVPRN